MSTTHELGLNTTLKKEAGEETPSCSICCENLTLKNIVNPECGHATCKDCFWRWAKDKNTCPFCRTSLLKNDEEAQDIQNMRELLEHRTQIIRQVEQSYEEKDEVTRVLRRKRNRLAQVIEGIDEANVKLKKIKKVHGGTYQTFIYFKEKIVEMTCKDRRKREKIDEASANLAHGDKGMCLEVLRDIKILGRSRPQRWKYGWFCQPMLGKVREMNKVRKERQKFRYSGELFSGWERGLRNLFQENEEDSDTDSMPELEENSDYSGSDMDIDHTANLILTPPSRSFRQSVPPAIRMTRGGQRIGRRLHARPEIEEDQNIQGLAGFYAPPRGIGTYILRRSEQRRDFEDVFRDILSDLHDNNNNIQREENAARDYTDAVQQEIIAARGLSESND